MRKLIILFILFAATAVAVAQEPPKTIAAQSDAKKAFEKLKIQFRLFDNRKTVFREKIVFFISFLNLACFPFVLKRDPFASGAEYEGGWYTKI